MEQAEHEGPTYNWQCVTDPFIEACDQLELGELLHDSSFGLFEAMSAIEMMDVKMDAGMMCNQIKREVRNLQQSVQAGTVKLNSLQHSELIGIMDASLACMVTWLEGHSLAQTVFTNLYFHDPSLIEDRCLKAFSICMLKIVDLIRDRINRAGVFEEEDFQPLTYGFKMGCEVTDLRAIGMMKEVEDDLNRNIRHIKGLMQGEAGDSEKESEYELCVAVCTRIKFYKLLLSVLIAFSKDKCEGVPQAQKLIGQVLELIKPMKTSVSLGIQPEEREVTKNDYPTIMGFEPLINQRLLPPTFPRYTVIHSRDSSLDYMETLLNRLEMTTAVLNANNIQEVYEVFKEFSKLSPCVLTRSILQLTFLPPSRRVFGKHTLTDFLKDSVRAFVMPPALAPKAPIYNNPEVKQYVDALMTRAVRPICTVLQITGHNRARQRDKWAHLLDEMASLQDEADKVDGYLHQVQMKTDPNRQYGSSFGTWVLYYTLQVMVNYTLSGFELELYAPYEYHYVYWYLYELLYSWLFSTIQRADSFVTDHEAYIDMVSSKGRGGKKNKKKRRSKGIQKEANICQAQQNMFGGYYKAVMGLQLANKLKHPNFEYDKEEVRYSHRFAPFACVSTPPMVPYSQFKEMTSLIRYSPMPTAADLFTTSCKFFHQAKTLYETIPSPSEEIQKVIRIAKTNFVMMKLLSGGHKQDSQVQAEFDFSLHRLFPIIKV
ncbi:N-alpha-acetyltransferase 35, NatC auxiliary subunit-like isoform X2 [Mercenaria mercenaria]|nr:N-alpha-acetyltransferase 35, NatC auxiliary subunit-like isoform X2 [Mercenaria mercenaria]XP_053405930.1 N-alpha-acetyltransferase 35, NatC auxiliary subunit-like isoform X2 [Mercenaria mercenaria]